MVLVFANLIIAANLPRLQSKLANDLTIWDATTSLAFPFIELTKIMGQIMTSSIKLPKLFLSLFFIGLFAPLAISPGSAASATPTSEVIERFHAQLLSVMKEAKTLGLQGRYSRLEPEIEQSFDLKLMIRIATGNFWKNADQTQQQELISSFKKLSVSTYASQFDGFSGQSFKTIGERTGPQETLLVDTNILRPNKDPVKITYVMKGDRIIDVLLDSSISELAVRRSEYNQILNGAGVNGLIETLNKKAEGLIAAK